MTIRSTTWNGNEITTSSVCDHMMATWLVFSAGAEMISWFITKHTKDVAVRRRGHHPCVSQVVSWKVKPVPWEFSRSIQAIWSFLSDKNVCVQIVVILLTLVTWVKFRRRGHPQVTIVLKLYWHPQKCPHDLLIHACARQYTQASYVVKSVMPTEQNSSCSDCCRIWLSIDNYAASLTIIDHY